MKKITCFIFTILFVLSVSAQSFSEKVFQCEYNGSKSSPPNLFIHFDYPNSNLTIKGSDEGSTLKLKYKEVIRDSKKLFMYIPLLILMELKFWLVSMIMLVLIRS